MKSKMEKIINEIKEIAAELALENNSFYQNEDIKIFEKKLLQALLDGGLKEVNRVKSKIKYAGHNEDTAAFMAGRG